ncbi:hypothetical protein CPT_Marzo_174 [Stenotrophomonas phage Marzo]|nr:hypothetical protein CPT_Marzo_174 [Stenotrophomonas phage Marzo]
MNNLLAFPLTLSKRECVDEILEGNDQDKIDLICQWYDYEKNHMNRHKCWHHLMLRDGTEVDGTYYPNADSWTRMTGNGPDRLKDSQIGAVKISRKQWDFD